jgi:membrane fusion protein, macrolide-specific efflux system
VDSATGKTWVLRQAPDRDPAWVPVRGPELPPPARPDKEPASKSATSAVVPPANPAPPPPAKGEATGRLALDRTARVHPRTPGLVTNVHVRAGATVAAGQLIAELDSTDARLAVDAAMANLAVAEVSVPPRERSSGTQEVRLAEAQVKNAQVEVERAKAALQATKLVAPVAGTMVELNVAAGDVVTPTGPPLGVVADLKALVAATDVAEADAGKVAVGQECVVRVGAGGAEVEYAGVVVGVGATLDAANGTVPVRVRLRTPDGTKPPRAGSLVSVRFLDKK